MSEGNGSPVTWRELNLALSPLKEGLSEVRSDVKLLLGAHAGDEAVSGFQRWLFGTVVVLVSGAIGTLLYLAVGG